MKQHWYENDWFICACTVGTFLVAAVVNYLIHGGHIVW